MTSYVCPLVLFPQKRNLNVESQAAANFVWLDAAAKGNILAMNSALMCRRWKFL